jgi:hypothetical protein
MIKYIAYNLPSVLKITDAIFFEETGISAKEFNSWKDDFEDLDEDHENSVKDYLSEEFKITSPLFAFAEPFKARGFVDVDDDSSPEEQVSFSHENMGDLVLVISEDGYELSDMREGIQLPGIYDFSEWKHVDKILTECEAYAKNDMDKYIEKWVAAVPKD